MAKTTERVEWGELTETVKKELQIYLKGVLNSEEVSEVLKASDVLLLPTWYEGEGYPGVIIEGYGFGVPCITTNWINIPEIVDDGHSGILIPPNDKTALKEAILSINQTNYKSLSEGAIQKAKEFDELHVHREVFRILHEV